METDLGSHSLTVTLSFPGQGSRRWGKKEEVKSLPVEKGTRNCAKTNLKGTMRKPLSTSESSTRILHGEPCQDLHIRHSFGMSITTEVRRKDTWPGSPHSTHQSPMHPASSGVPLPLLHLGNAKK